MEITYIASEFYSVKSHRDVAFENSIVEKQLGLVSKPQNKIERGKDPNPSDHLFKEQWNNDDIVFSWGEQQQNLEVTFLFTVSGDPENIFVRSRTQIFISSYNR